MEKCLETSEENQSIDSPAQTQPAVQKWNIDPNTKPRMITFAVNHRKKEKNCNVEDNKPVIYYAKKYEMSEDIILYSHKHDAMINFYIPCRALEDREKIEIICKNKYKQRKTILSTLPHSNFDVCEEGTFFKVQCKGYTNGGSPRNILKDDRYNWNNKPFAVYGLKNQTIVEAILNDRRFNILNEFNLKHPNESALNEKNMRLSSLDPNVVYTVLVENDTKSHPKIPETECLQSFAEDAKDRQDSDDITPEVSQTSSVPQSEPKIQVPEMNKIYCTSTSTSTKFSNGFDILSKKFGERQLRTDIMRDHIRYKKPMQADTFKLLNQHLESVAMITCTVDNRIYPLGTFFLLTECLGLTCFHVLESLLGSNPDWKTKPPLNISVIFNYDKESDEKVECSAILEYYEKEFDFAFLSISSPQSKEGLLRYVAHPPQDGAVSIIGHPSGKPKKIDPICTVINFSKRAEEIAEYILSDKSYIHVLTEYNFTLMSDPELVTYDTCLYVGASGSPVFNDHGELMAMHTGGYLARTDLAKKSIIEYGRNIIDILICGAIHLEELRPWFRKISELDNSLTTYLRAYTKQDGHSVKMQPIIRDFLRCFVKEESPQVENADDSGIAMDTSV